MIIAAKENPVSGTTNRKEKWLNLDFERVTENDVEPGEVLDWQFVGGETLTCVMRGANGYSKLAKRAWTAGSGWKIVGEIELGAPIDMMKGMGSDKAVIVRGRDLRVYDLTTGKGESIGTCSGLPRLMKICGEEKCVIVVGGVAEIWNIAKASQLANCAYTGFDYEQVCFKMHSTYA
jgi:hypothetical protein